MLNWRTLVLAPLIATPCWALAAQIDKSTPSITVQAQHESVAQWSARVGQSLNRELVYPRPMGTADFDEGLAKVSFRCTEDGKPGDITLMHSSGSHALDRAAMLAVKKISTLHPLPDGIGHDRPMQAWVAFAGDEDSLKRMTRNTQREAQMANAEAEKYRAGQQVASVPALVISAG